MMIYITDDVAGSKVAINESGLQSLINKYGGTITFTKAGNRSLFQLIQLAIDYDTPIQTDYEEMSGSMADAIDGDFEVVEEEDLPGDGATSD